MERVLREIVSNSKDDGAHLSPKEEEATQISPFPCEWEWDVLTQRRQHHLSGMQRRWVPYDGRTQRAIAAIEKIGADEGNSEESNILRTQICSWKYEIDLRNMTQRNVQTGRIRSIRKTDRPLIGESKNAVEGGKDVGEDISVNIITMNGDKYSVTIKSKISVMALKRNISHLAGTSAYEMSLYLQPKEDTHTETQQTQGAAADKQEQEEQKPLSNRRRLHELEDPVLEGSTLLLIVGHRMGIGDILCDIEAFYAEGKLHSTEEATLRRRRQRLLHHMQPHGPPFAGALQDAIRQRGGGSAGAGVGVGTAVRQEGRQQQEEGQEQEQEESGSV